MTEFNVDGDRAISLNNLGLAARGQGDLPKARKYFEDAVKLMHKAFEDRTHPPWLMDFLMMADNLGDTLCEMGDARGALPYCAEATRAAEEYYGDSDPEVATFHNNLGKVYLALGDEEHAQHNFERALEIDRAHHPKYHSAIARDLANLGSLLDRRGNSTGARELLEQALEIEEATLGPEHPELISTLANLACACTEPTNILAGRRHLKRALDIGNNRLGESHPLTKDIRERLVEMDRHFPEMKQSGQRRTREEGPRPELLDPHFRYPDLAAVAEGMAAGTVSTESGCMLARKVTGGEIRHTSVGRSLVIGPSKGAAQTLANLQAYCSAHGPSTVERWAGFVLMVEAQLGICDLDPGAASIGLAGALRALEPCLKATGGCCPPKAVEFAVHAVDSVLGNPACTNRDLRTRLTAARASFSACARTGG